MFLSPFSLVSFLAPIDYLMGKDCLVSSATEGLDGFSVTPRYFSAKT